MSIEKQKKDKLFNDIYGFKFYAHFENNGKFIKNKEYLTHCLRYDLFTKVLCDNDIKYLISNKNTFIITKKNKNLIFIDCYSNKKNKLIDLSNSNNENKKIDDYIYDFFLCKVKDYFY